jgi:hypothetical protein
MQKYFYSVSLDMALKGLEFGELVVYKSWRDRNRAAKEFKLFMNPTTVLEQNHMDGEITSSGPRRKSASVNPGKD